MGELILPDHHGQLAAPPAAIEHKRKQERTLVPAIFQRAGWWQVSWFYVEPERFAYTVRSHHRTLHVMIKAEDATLCRCAAPDGYPVLRGLTQDENAELMTTDKRVAPWHKMLWCPACVPWARFLTVKNYGPQPAA